MPCLTTRIEIAAPPEVVREKFLDFSQIPKYSPNGLFKSITSLAPNGTFNPGDTIAVPFPISAENKPVVVENNPSTFSWCGGINGLFYGIHAFHFAPSEETQGHTTFIQEEKFSGMLGWFLGEGWLAKMAGARENTKRNFEGFSKDLKVWCEKE